MMLDRFGDDRLSISSLCKKYRLSRQAYYQSMKRKAKRTLHKERVLDYVVAARKQLPREGGRKLYKRLKPELEKAGFKLGRDKLFDLLRSEGMLVNKKRRYVTTTQSKHRFYIYENKIKNQQAESPHQQWVSDITYIRTQEGFMYLALITDVYSRKVVGFDVRDSLELTGCVRALHQALKQLPKGHNLIHHSDRGIQYCSYLYTHLLKQNNITISMAAKGNCYENAIAERLNGILKDEFMLDECFKSKKIAKKAVKDAIDLYNNVRLHMSIGYRTPAQQHAA